MRIRNTLSLLALLAPSLSADVRVVGPGGPFFTIQAAIDAAQDGDIVLVKGTSNSPFTIHAKSLTIVPDTGLTVGISGMVKVDGLAPSQSVTLMRLNVNSQLRGTPGFYATANQGALRVSDCTFHGDDGRCPCSGPFSPAFEGAAIDSTSNAAFSRCTFIGGAGAYIEDEDIECCVTPGADGLLLSGSRVALFDCIARGGGGGGSYDTTCHSGQRGGDGCHTTSFLFASGSTLQGGPGGQGGDGELFCGAGSGGPGGTGLSVIGGTAAALLACTITGGPGGFGGWGAPGGPPGQAITGPTLPLAGTARHFRASAPTREQQSVALTFQGEPGDKVYLWGGPELRFLFIVPWNGVQFVRVPPYLTAIPLGVIPSGGIFQMSVPIGELGPGVHGNVLHRQAVFVGTSASFLADEQQFVLLDSAF